jgi:enamine deaminase RidA (YjgF/YER057c/UK114 family)
MTSERINPAELARPSGFSHAVSVAGGPAGGGPAGGGAAGGGAAAGRMVFLAGQTGVDRDGNVADGGVVPQFERAMTNLLTALGAAGGLPSDLVSLTIYLTDVPDYQAHAREIGAVWRRLAGTEYPAMAAVGVTRLWLPELLVEIQGIAVVSG